MLRCGHCKTEKVKSEFYVNAKHREGYDNYCKTCRKASVAETQRRRAAKKKAAQPDYGDHKKCYRCGEIKSRDNFHNDSRAKDGKLGRCKACVRKENVEDYAKNKEQEKIKHADQYAQNKETIKEKSLEDYYAKHEENKARKRRYHAAHREEIKGKRAAKAEQIRVSRKAHREQHAEEIRIYNRKHSARRRASGDIRYILKVRMSRSLRRALKNGKQGRHWEDLVGYTVDELRHHLEKQFSEGMTWELFHRGDIQIDHIIPLSVFTFTSAEDYQFNVCWSLKNLRPMWKEDNYEKHDKLLEPFQQFLF